MKTLTKEQKATLNELLNHRWFQLLEELVKDFEYSVLDKLRNIDLSNEKDLSILWKNQNYLKWVQDFITTIKSKTNTIGKVNITVKVTGGGSTGQAGAFRLGLSRALTLFDQENKSVLKKALLLRRDSRMKERQKPGQKGARKRFQWVKR